jgi:hypothetical protein
MTERTCQSEICSWTAISAVAYPSPARWMTAWEAGVIPPRKCSQESLDAANSAGPGTCAGVSSPPSNDSSRSGERRCVLKRSRKNLRQRLAATCFRNPINAASPGNARPPRMARSVSSQVSCARSAASTQCRSGSADRSRDVQMNATIRSLYVRYRASAARREPARTCAHQADRLHE